MSIQNIPKLEDLAFKVCYNDVLSTLALCQDHRPQGKEVPWLLSSSVIAADSFFTSENIRSLVKSRLYCQHLVGSMSEKVRRKFVQLFYENLVKDDCKEGNIDIWAFLDCVLNESFEDLETHIAVRDTEPCPLLIPTIAVQAPLIKKLTLNFYLMKKSHDRSFDLLGKLENVIKSLSSLQHLTELCLVGVAFSSRIPVMSHIGKSCPLLIQLTVLGGDTFSNTAVLALTLGELVNDLFPTGNYLIDSTIENLVIPPELRTPICSTLRRLVIFPTYLEDLHRLQVPISPSAVAFTLRHFPFLEALQARQSTTSPIVMCVRPSVVVSAVTAIAITSLYGTEEWKSWKEFKQLLQHAATSTQSQLAIPPSLLSATLSNGLLRLTELDAVSVKHTEMLRAIGSLCPLLNRIGFCELTETYVGGVYREIENLALPEDLENLFREWPKLTSIGFDGVPPEYVRIILKVFSPTLQCLELNLSESINLRDLAICNQLESLRLSCPFRSGLKESNEGTAFNADNNFLPNLKSFQSAACLGPLSSLFEGKANLIYLKMNCCHVGLGGGLKSGRHDQLNWSQIPKLWSGLETLAVEQFSGFTMEMASYLIPRLRKLKKIMLPGRIEGSDDRALFDTIINELSSRGVPQAEITLNHLPISESFARCHLLGPNMR